MKYIAFKAYDGGITTKGILTTVLNQNPRGMMIDEIRRRCKLMDAIEGASNLIVKDDDFNFLSDAIKSFPFSVAVKGLLSCLDDILSADEPPASLRKNGSAHGDATGEAKVN